MIELIQVPYSPYCIVQRRILEFSGVRFKVRDIPNVDRSLVWKLTKQRYYQVPIIRDGANVLFETDSDSQVISKYLDEKLGLGLFPREWAGVQDLIWPFLENDLEGITFKLNDVYFRELVPVANHLPFIRHKERKFGRGCLDQWREQQTQLVGQLQEKLGVCEQMLGTRDFLLDHRPRFVDFDLFGMLGNFLYSGHYQLPGIHARLNEWHQRMAKVKLTDFQGEKLHS